MPLFTSRARRSRTSAVRTDQPVVWGREKLLAVLVGGVVVVALLCAGLVLAVVGALRPGQGSSARLSAGSTVAPVGRLRPGNATAGPGSGDAAAAGPAASGSLDELAARLMPSVPESASHPMRVSLTDPGEPIVLPTAGSSGPAGVPTGFPHTPQGALAQLAAIDSAALGSASLPGARTVITGWAQPGGPTPASWSGVRAIAGLLDAAGTSGGSGGLAVVAIPAMGLVKGTVGADAVVACIDFEVDVTLNSTARGALADCQRMVWAGGRWMIGPGAEPADPPSVWPSTDLARQVGYRDLRRG